MEQDGIIKQVTEQTDWVSSLVYSRKQNGRLCVCLSKYLNCSLKSPHHKTPTLDELTHHSSEQPISANWMPSLDIGQFASMKSHNC